MKFVLDENFPKSAAPFLGSLGHEVLDTRKLGFCGKDDEFLFRFTIKESACFLTTDRDFFHTIPHSYKTHFGVIVIALSKPNRKVILQRLEWVISKFSSQHIIGRVFQIRDNACYVYPSIPDEENNRR